MATAVWNGHITFGLVSIPVKLVVAARSESISFNQLHKKDHSRVKQVLYCQAEDQPVDRSELVKGYEYEKGQYVVIDEEDLKQIQPRTAKVMEILEFVKLDEVDAVFLESSYYVQPDDAGEKPYTLLFAAMKEERQAAVAKITMHNREHTVLLRPSGRGLILHTLFYQDEIRATNEFRADTSQITEPQMKMARNLIEAMAGTFKPEEFHDTYREELNAMIQAKIKGNKVVALPKPEERAPVIDMMEALQRSLSNLKKPPARDAGQNEAEPARPRPIKAAKRRAG
jgi:DNA end-binding protein Ku